MVRPWSAGRRQGTHTDICNHPRKAAGGALGVRQGSAESGSEPEPER